MESPTPVSRYIPQNSKKRSFMAGSSSSGCKDAEVLEIPPPINRSSKPKSSKQKEVIYQEIIDVDLEEDSREIVPANEGVASSAKGKEIVPNYLAGLSILADNEPASNALTSNNGAGTVDDSINVEDYNSDSFYGEEDWIDSYYEDGIFDDYAAAGSYFDHMDIPTGVEAPFPWLSNSTTIIDMNLPTNSTSKYPNFQPQLNSSQSPQPLNLPQTNNPSTPLPQINNLSTPNSGKDTSSGSKHSKEKIHSKSYERSKSHKKSAASSFDANASLQHSTGSATSKAAKEILLSLGKNKRKPRSSHASTAYPSHYSQYSVSTFPNVNGGSSYPTMNMPTSTYPFGAGNYAMPSLQNLPMNNLQPSVGPTNNLIGPSSIPNSLPAKIDQIDVDKSVQMFEAFKKFDTVEDFSDHHYCNSGSSAKQAPKNWAKRIQEEWKILEKDLPAEIFVRVYESRMDLLRAVIIGAEGTPYQDGLFFFDVFFPSSYPNVPPHVHYHSGGLRINPNLYNCGKVCLSLLNTWTGGQKEKWLPGVSTMLQVLVSIQGLILNAKPYFNEPGYANTSGTPTGEKRSLEYNENTYIYSLQTMVYSIRRPPKYFEEFVRGYFCKNARDILVSCKAYMEGVQVGCLAKGGVQDVDEGDKNCSQQFKTRLAGFIALLVNAFTEIGANNCREFLSLAQRGNLQSSIAARNALSYY
ncbi:hypothetical protein ABFX02_08G184700 [Erythranthe guttata]